MPDTIERAGETATAAGRRAPVPFRRASTLLLAIIVVAFVLRLGLFLVALRDPQRFYTLDSREYWQLSREFAAAYGDTGSAFFELGLRRTPGYPAFIAGISAVFGSRESVVVFAQVLLSVATVPLLYLLTRDLWSERAALFAAAFLAVDPISVVMPIYLQPETLFTLLLVGGTLVMVRGMRSRRGIVVAGAGALFGLSVLVRPVTLYLSLVLVPVAWLLCARREWKQRLLFTAILLASFAVIAGGWIVRNERTTGIPIVSTIEGRDLLEFRAAHALAFEEGISVREARRELVTTVDREGQRDSAAERSRRETALAVDTLLDHPVGAAVGSVRGAGRLLFGPGNAQLFRLLGAEDPRQIRGGRAIVVGFELAILLALLVGATFGAIVAVRRRRWEALAVGLGFAAYLILISSSGGAFSRYRSPAAPYLALLAGVGCAALSAWIGRKAARVEAPDAP